MQSQVNTNLEKTKLLAMDIIEIRRANLRRWVLENGTPVKERSLFSQLQGTGSFGEKVARRLESQYKMPPMYLDEGGLPAMGAKAARPRSNVIVQDPDDEQGDEFLYVPESRIEFAGGNGRVATYELVEDEEPATYRRSWFQKYGINPDRVRRFRVSGDSMEPMLYARDTILVNEDERNIIDGKMYAIRYGDELRVKYLSRRLDGTLLLRSVNPAYAIEEVSPELAQEHISIIGRVRDTSGTGGL